MSEFQLTHIALVGARMSAFRPYGYAKRTDLSFHRVAPDLGERDPEQFNRTEVNTMLRDHLPLWIHNIIADPTFPGRRRLLMPLRRFEGELRDNRNDEVVAAVLSAGFKGQDLDPLNLPASMPMRQRCSILMHAAVWQDALRQLESDTASILAENLPAISLWLASARQPGRSVIEESYAVAG